MTWIMYSLEYVRCSQNKDMKGAIRIWRQYVTRFLRCVLCLLFRAPLTPIPPIKDVVCECSLPYVRALLSGRPASGVAWPLTWHLPIPSHITGHWELIGRESNRHFPLRLLSLKDLDEILSTCEWAFSTLGMESKQLSATREFAKIYQNQVLWYHDKGLKIHIMIC